MKILKVKTSHPNKQTFLISDLTFIKKNPYPNTLPENKRNAWLNDGMNDMGFRAEIIESIDQFDSIANQRVYPLKKHIIKIKAVDFNGKTIKKLVGRPKERDLT